MGTDLRKWGQIYFLPENRSVPISEERAVELFVVGDLARPGEVGRHRVLDELRPGRAVGVPRERGPDAPEHALRVCVEEDAAVADAGRGIEMLDRVREPARRAHDRDRAVAQGVHL